MATEARLPTFLIIGAQKSATRWLRSNLGEHPDVFTASSELAFFNDIKRFTELGPAGYAALFGAADEKALVGEATPGYMIWRHRPAVVAERIEQVVPAVSLIAILRNPVDRAQSALVHHIHGGQVPAGTRLVDAVRSIAPERDRLGLISGGWYAESLEPYRDRFGSRVLVLLNDDAVSDPGRVYSDALRHIGARVDAVPAHLGEKRFSREAKGQAEVAPALRPEDRIELWEYFRSDVERLEEMFGLDLGRWRPGGATGPAPGSTA